MTFGLADNASYLELRLLFPVGNSGVLNQKVKSETDRNRNETEISLLRQEDNIKNEQAIC